MKNFYNKTTFSTRHFEDDININKYLPANEPWVEYTPGEETQELLDALAYKTQDETIAHLKGLYLGVVNDKLSELDYDSLATVKLWEGDATFGAEASKILAWYKSIIAYNYQLLTAGSTITDDDYLNGLPKYV